MKKLSSYLPKVLTALIAIVALSFGIYYHTEANKIFDNYSSSSLCIASSEDVTTDEDGNKIAPVNEIKLNRACLAASNADALSFANYKEQAALTSYTVAIVAVLFLINSVGHTTQSSTSKKRN